MTKAKQKRYAEEILASLQTDKDMEVDHLAAEHGLEHGEVVEILDEYRVTDGKPVHVGPGGGGGWLGG